MEKITTVNINNKDYKLTESAYILLSDYNNYIKKTIPVKEKILDLEIQISVILDMELEGKGKDPVVNIETVEEVIKVLKENQNIYYDPNKTRQAKVHKMHKKRKQGTSSNMRRDTKKGILGGVCAGIADKSNIDPTLLRLLFIIAAILTGFGLMFIIYIVLWIVIPTDK